MRPIPVAEYVHVNLPTLLPGRFAALGEVSGPAMVPVPESNTAGETLFALVSPVLETVSITVITCPRDSVTAGIVLMYEVRADGIFILTVFAAVTLLVTVIKLSFASVPDALAVSVKVPLPVAVNVQLNTAAEFPAMFTAVAGFGPNVRAEPPPLTV